MNEYFITFSFIIQLLGILISLYVGRLLIIEGILVNNSRQEFSTLSPKLSQLVNKLVQWGPTICIFFLQVDITYLLKCINDFLISVKIFSTGPAKKENAKVTVSQSCYQTEDSQMVYNGNQNIEDRLTVLAVCTYLSKPLKNLNRYLGYSSSRYTDMLYIL